MRPFKEFYFRLTHATPERKASRANLKKAKDGDAEAYLALAANYLDFALIYFGSYRRESGLSRAARVEKVFTALWRQLGYAERVSDFEFMLASALSEYAPKGGAVESSEPLVTRLRLLKSQNRFALIAHDFENWPIRWVSLLMRVRPTALHQLLSEARCELCGVRWESLTKDERECLVAISVSMASHPNLRANKALYQRVASFPSVAEIKSLWLELRPHLVEVRYRYLLEQSEHEQMLRNLFTGIQSASRNQAPLMDRVVNSVHFTRHGKIKVS